MTAEPVAVGVVGCGTISAIYLHNCAQLADVEVVACADLDRSRARQRAEEFDVARACGVDELLADPQVQVVLDLTTPPAHATVALAALEAGKHVYNEKPLTVERADARRILELASERQLLVGCAPDTFLGAGLQTCRALLDGGVLGEPVAATAVMMSRGHERWHPDPAFYYQTGGGPLFDMGPYYLTALIALLGPVRRVTGSARRTFRQRVITSEPKRGTTIDVEVPTHLAGVLDFASGPVVTLVTSFDVWATQSPRLELHGSEASLVLPDPNTFGGPVQVRAGQDSDWRDVPLEPGYEGNARGIGLADLAQALRDGRPNRANAAMAAHVLDVIHALHESSDRGRHVELASTCERPEPLPDGWADTTGALTPR